MAGNSSLDELYEEGKNARDSYNKFKGEQNEYELFRKPINTYSSDFMELFQDPTYLGFKIFFHGIGQTEKSNTVNNTGLLGPEANQNSALFYLRQLEGANGARYNMLKDFKSMLIKLNTEYPWYFQSILGLDDAWKREIDKPFINKELTINCLESLDLRMTSLMDLYRKIVYDWKNRRYILPDNLRHFDMTVRVYDWRDFGLTQSNLDKLLKLGNIEHETPKGRATKINTDFLGAEEDKFEQRTQVAFEFKFCEFMPDDSGAMLNTISNAKPTQASQVIKIHYQNVEESSIYKILKSLGNNPRHYYVKDYLNKELEFLANQSDPLFKPEAGIKDILATVGNELAANAVQKGSNFVTSKLNNLYLGNVYGFSPVSLAENPIGSVTNAVTSGVQSFNSKETANNLGNAFDNVRESLPGGRNLGNVFPENESRGSRGGN